MSCRQDPNMNNTILLLFITLVSLKFNKMVYIDTKDSKESHLHTPLKDASEIFQMTSLLTALTSVIGCISRRLGDLIIGIMKLLLKVISDGKEEVEQGPMSYVLFKLPNMVQGAISCLKLNRQNIEYAVCPDFHCTYMLRTDCRSGHVVNPDICTNKSAPGASQCDAEINDRNNKPKKTFLCHDFKDYLAALFSQGDLEEYLDDSCDKFKEAYEAQKNFDNWDKVTNIFQGNSFNNLKILDSSNPTESSPFLVQKRGKSCLKSITLCCGWCR